MLMDAELREYLCLQQAKLEFEEASSIAGAMAYNEKIGEYNSNDKKVYDIEGVTGG